MASTSSEQNKKPNEETTLRLKVKSQDGTEDLPTDEAYYETIVALNPESNEFSILRNTNTRVLANAMSKPGLTQAWKGEPANHLITLKPCCPVTYGRWVDWASPGPAPHPHRSDYPNSTRKRGSVLQKERENYNNMYATPDGSEACVAEMDPKLGSWLQLPTVQVSSRKDIIRYRK
ncbi:hypothetical protein IEQ34_001878 [Dendrobium chrysotoxum]|uniref:Uncharacterized protein n=1 Tax=Dendrobium chrysotoxum TaxID=161865 RepID=A0AAV7HHZ7_DENCH|nr:hypothetical protein IEQ34_001878 [Dendrobium chrysotoxum]